MISRNFAWGVSLLALALAGLPGTVAAQNVDNQIPLIEPAEVAPPTVEDFNRAEDRGFSSGTTASVPESTEPDAAPDAAQIVQSDETLPALEAEQTAQPEAAPATDAAQAVQPAETSPALEAEQAAQPETAPATDAEDTASVPESTDAVAEQAAEPALTAEEIAKLTGKDLVKAPVAADLAPADLAVAEKLRDLLATNLSGIVDRRDERAGVEAFYRDRGFAPVWIEHGSRAARAQAAETFLGEVDEDGLEPADYAIPSFSTTDPEALADADARMTAVVLNYARHASIGRSHYSRISSEIEYKREAPDAGETLKKLAGSPDIGSALAALQPSHPQYAALKAKLAEARGQTEEAEIVRVPQGPTLKPGMESSRVVALRKRLKIEDGENSEHYDEAVVDAVKRFQRGAGLVVDGLTGPATLRALNGVKRENTVDVIIANMERWRWLPRDLGDLHVIVNIPDFTIRVFKDGDRIWKTKTVVGRQSRETPLISTEMKSITVNPTWNVPPGIMARDYLPALRQDPSALERIGLRVERNRDGTLRIYQPPGDRNALGRLRFNTPNKFLVYLHDTPDKHLFGRDVRAYSSGCMRVEDPVRFAEIILNASFPDQNYSQQRIRSMYGPRENNIALPKPVMVHLTYQTAFVDDAGELQIRNDVYGHDRNLVALLNGSDRRVADIAIPRRRVQVSREELTWPGNGYGSRFDYEPRRRYDSRQGYGPRYGAYGRNPIEDFFRQIFR